ncbi:MAG: hypothetical protein B7Z78_13620 [Rhodospirillales bacterium 20-60-12]|nr:MAG: hypothetical protein B7Z78_13620 [Rhodospirillales bacterium 20-60-12]
MAAKTEPDMQLILHAPNEDTDLSDRYAHAFASAIEILVVNAYLTDWDKSLKLNPRCKHFRMIIGKDFGITRKAACISVMNWLPASLKANFLVADEIVGFHPKAVFWKDANGDVFAIVGSSNLTIAAFATNYEANIFCQISPDDYQAAKKWVANIIASSVPVSDDWLEQYREASRHVPKTSPKQTRVQTDDPVVSLTLPRPAGMNKQIDVRRQQLAEYAKNSGGLMTLFRNCAEGRITSDKFYNDLPKYWGGDVGGRLQGSGWERQGKGSDFQALSESFLRIVDAADTDRDDVVIEEMDRLAKNKVRTRSAFLSEMLCLKFPSLFPVVNKPVKEYLADIKFRAPSGASEGAKYLDLARKLRVSLKRNPNHPAKNLAELDAVIWLKYQ